jgi:hypothetical protein
VEEEERPDVYCFKSKAGFKPENVPGLRVLISEKEEEK